MRLSEAACRDNGAPLEERCRFCGRTLPGVAGSKYLLNQRFIDAEHARIEERRRKQRECAARRRAKKGNARD